MATNAKSYVTHFCMWRPRLTRAVDAKPRFDGSKRVASVAPLDSHTISYTTSLLIEVICMQSCCQNSTRPPEQRPFLGAVWVLEAVQVLTDSTASCLTSPSYLQQADQIYRLLCCCLI